MYCITSRIWDRPTRDCCTLSQRQNGYSVVPEHPHVGPHGPNRASFFMNPMYSIARTRQCPRKSCSPRQPMAAYMWNGLQPVTSFTFIPYPNPNPNDSVPPVNMPQCLHTHVCPLAPSTFQPPLLQLPPSSLQIHFQFRYHDRGTLKCTMVKRSSRGSPANLVKIAFLSK